MPLFKDGPASRLFHPLAFAGSVDSCRLPAGLVSKEMAEAAGKSPAGDCVMHGIPFRVRRVAVVAGAPIVLRFRPRLAPWLVFLHTSDTRPLDWGPDGFIRSSMGYGRLGEHAADYVVRFADGTERVLPVRRRYEVGAFRHPWGEQCFLATTAGKMHAVRAHHEQTTGGWGWSQTRVTTGDSGEFGTYLMAWKNPRPRVPVTGLRLVPVKGAVVLYAVSAGTVESHPLRWDRRRKMVWRMAPGAKFEPGLDAQGNHAGIQLDLGTVISAGPRRLYPNTDWEESLGRSSAPESDREILVEYAAHPEARFHFKGGRIVSVTSGRSADIEVVPPARQRVELKVVDRASGRPVAVKLHVHGAAGEYLAPVDRHKIPNDAWFEDYSADVIHDGGLAATYISGETTLDLPRGAVFLEICRGFEVRPRRLRVRVGPGTRKITVTLDKVLKWREKGWVTADTHVHFLSPVTGLLEGAAEGLNVINLLASQWGELMTNAGDFDGRTTWGSKEAGGDGEHLVRVGTENRQQVLGHISLLGYRGRIIAPMTTAGPDESALGDPVEALLSEWAERCRKQGGLVVLPHFPNPRAEGAAAVVLGRVDGVEMTSWQNLYGGIDPYSLSDWYRYLNCGYLVAAVGGTDKMAASTAAGTVRTYAKLRPGQEFTYEAWVAAVRRAETFVTYGPLVDFSVDGRPPGARVNLTGTGGTLAVEWKVQSVVTPMTRVELVVNGEIRESREVGPESGAGTFRLRADRSCWAALLVRGRYRGKSEIIAAHTSPVMVSVAGTPFLAAADADTILEQISGSLAFLDTIGTRAENREYRRMRRLLVSAHKSLHNRLHARGVFHHHPHR
jgi:hypothetical protein